MSKNLTQWQDYISTSLKKTALATLETAERINKYKESAESEDDFKSNMRSWFGFSATHLTYWSKINDASVRFGDSIKLIPSSTRTLYELSSIDDDLWNELIESGDIRPSITVEDAKSLKSSGGVIKRLAAKYADSPDYLDIYHKLKELKSTTDNISELKKEFNKWIKENPPSKLEVIESDDVIEAEYEEIVTPATYTTPATPSMSIEEAYKIFGISMTESIKNLRILKLLHQIADESEDINADEAIKVITGRR